MEGSWLVSYTSVKLLCCFATGVLTDATEPLLLGKVTSCRVENQN